jgi:hypothetical protein
VRGGQRTLFRELLRDTVLIIGSGKVSPVNHRDPTARPHRLNTDHTHADSECHIN